MFKAYLAYADQAGQDSEGIWERIKDRNDANSFDLSVLSKHDDADSNSSDEYNDATSYFITIFTRSAIKYNTRDVKNQLEIQKAIHILKSIIKKP